MNVPGEVHVVALNGSQRAGSHTREAVSAALDAAADSGASTDLIDLAEQDLPLFDPDHPDAGDAPAIRQRVGAADAVLLGSPMYHGSYASPVKTALDYCGFDEFEGTTVGLLVVSGGGFPTPALEHLRAVARALDGWVIPDQVAVPEAHTAIEDGVLTDEDLRERVDSLGTALVEYAGVQSYPETAAACAVPGAD